METKGRMGVVSATTTSSTKANVQGKAREHIVFPDGRH